MPPTHTHTRTYTNLHGEDLLADLHRAIDALSDDFTSRDRWMTGVDRTQGELHFRLLRSTYELMATARGEN